MKKSPPINKDLKVLFNGETKSLREWAKSTGLTVQTLYKRIMVNKLPLEDVFALENRGSIKDRSRKYKAFGMEKSICEWGRYSGLAPRTIANRINKYGFTIEEAVSIQPTKRRNAPLAFGKVQSYASWAKEYGVTYEQLWNRIKDHGESLEEALNYLSKKEK